MECELERLDEEEIETEIDRLASQDPIIAMVLENGGVRISGSIEDATIPARFIGRNGLPLDELSNQAGAIFARLLSTMSLNREESNFRSFFPSLLTHNNGWTTSRA